MSVNEKMTAIAENIRRYSTATGLLTLDDMANGVRSVYYFGYDEGYSTGESHGAINAIRVEEKDVNFWDYDGRLICSYTLDEIQDMVDLPNPPTDPHELLRFENWNWSIDNIKAHNRPLDVGAIYNTVDNATYIFISIVSNTLLEVPLYFNQSVSNGIVIDWGDGNTTTIDGTGNKNTSHTYATKGRYVIKMTPQTGTLGLGWNDGTNTLLGTMADADNSKLAIVDAIFVGKATVGQYAFCRMGGLTKVSLAEVTTVGKYTAEFSTCRALKHINMPRSATFFGNLYFQNCIALALVVTGHSVTSTSANTCINCHSLRRTYVARGITSIGYGIYYYCYSIKRAYIADTVKTIGASSLTFLSSLAELEIPSGVTSIADSAFSGMTALRKAVFKPTTPPTVSNANAFNGWSADCIVEVPKGCLTAYKNATNYANIASRMVEVS